MTQRDQELTDFTLEELEEERRPRGKNDLSSFAMFFQRNKYKEDVYPKFIVPTPFDLWYDKDKAYFGRVNEKGFPIVLRERYLKQINSPEDQNTWAMDFVVDAFNDFRDHYVFLNKRNAEENVFKFLNPKRAWRSSPVSYNNYLDGIFDDFSVIFLGNNRDKEMKTFNDFLQLFLKYMRYSEGKFPITFSQFSLSHLTSPNSSGLIVELSDSSHGNDIKKYDEFISNINFECYANTAQQFGFKLDKNYPGRLIADVKSPKMQEYMSRYPKPPAPFTLTKPEPPSIPAAPTPPEQESGPWKAGDVIEIYIVVPNDPKEKFFILTDYTLPKNQAFPAGSRSILFRTEDGREIDQLEFLREYFEGYGELIKYGFKINNPNPNTGIQDRIPGQVSLEPRTDNSYILGDLIDYEKNANLVNVPLPNSRNFDVMSVNRIFEEEYKTNAEAAAHRRNLRNSGIDSTTTNAALTPQEILGQPLSYSSGLYKVREYEAGDAGKRFIAELPRSAVHVKPSPASSTLSKRVLNFYDISRRGVIYQKQLKVWRENKAKLETEHQQEMENYISLKERHNQAVEEFNTLPRLSFRDLTKARYNLTYRADLEMMREMLMQFYYSYASAKPQIFVKKAFQCGDRNVRTKTTIIDREKITKTKVMNKYTDSFWLKYYVMLKNYEKAVRLPKRKLNQIILQSHEVYHKKGLDESLKFITVEFNNIS
tara:strand:+ start:3493 stop:5616 length:2124 start_codon:yes stop_codon:yes gene_type:complete